MKRVERARRQVGAGTGPGGASWERRTPSQLISESQSPGMASAARSAPVRVTAACSPQPAAAAPLGRGLACRAPAGGVWCGGGGVGVCGPGSWEGFCLFGSPCGCCRASGQPGGGRGRELGVGGKNVGSQPLDQLDV